MEVVDPVVVPDPEVGLGVVLEVSVVEPDEGVGVGGAIGMQVLASTLGHLSAKKSLS